MSNLAPRAHSAIETSLSSALELVVADDRPTLRALPRAARETEPAPVSERRPRKSDGTPDWSPEREAADYATWIAAVPSRHRTLVRTWIASCGTAGRSEAWHLAHLSKKPVSFIAEYLLSTAREFAKARTGLTCSLSRRTFGKAEKRRKTPCGRPAIMQTDLGTLVCSECCSPFEFLRSRAQVST